MARTYKHHKPLKVLSSGFIVERWSGKAWYPSMCSPYKTMAKVRKHLDEHWWHYTDSNPYRIKDYKPPKQKIQTYKPKYNFSSWNTDSDMVIINKVMK